MVQPLRRGLANPDGISLFPTGCWLGKDSLWNRNAADESRFLGITAFSLPSFRPRTRLEATVVVTERRNLMYYGRSFGRGGGMGYGRGMGYGGGMGFGFRGYSPPWPYVGIGRGGLPRCWAYGAYGTAAYGPAVPYTPGPWAFGGGPYSPPDEIRFLNDQAAMIKEELEAIDARIKELEKEKSPGGES